MHFCKILQKQLIKNNKDDNFKKYEIKLGAKMINKLYYLFFMIHIDQTNNFYMKI